MGHTAWNEASYVSTASTRAATGKDWGYHKTMSSAPAASRKAHDTLDPKGVKFRESRDSDAHPASNAIVVGLDVTGSMSSIPRVMQTKLAGLMRMLLAKNYLADPHVLFGAIGDGFSDRVPLQVGQFESGIEMDADLNNLFLEAGGGGTMSESYELFYYFMARHTAIDCFEKRNKRGYLFTVGDELCYPVVSKDMVASVIGDTLQEDIPTAEIIQECMKMYECYHIIPSGANHTGDSRLLTGHEQRGERVPGWTELLNQNVVQLDNVDLVCETIAAIIGVAEGVADASTIVKDLADAGIGSGSESVSRAISTIASGSLADVAVADGELAPSDGGDGLAKL